MKFFNQDNLAKLWRKLAIQHLEEVANITKLHTEQNLTPETLSSVSEHLLPIDRKKAVEFTKEILNELEKLGVDLGPAYIILLKHGIVDEQ